MPLVQLLYCSEHNFDFFDPLFCEQINSILCVSQRHNFEQQITGVLLAAHRGFVQILEGERSPVLKLFRKIEQDTRHFNVVLLSVQEISERNYEGWSMACVQTTPLNAHLFGPFLENEAFRPDLAKSSSLVSVLCRLSGLGLMKQFIVPAVKQPPEAWPLPKVPLDICDSACSTRLFESEDAAAAFIAALKRATPGCNLPYVIVHDRKESARFSIKILVSDVPAMSGEDVID